MESKLDRKQPPMSPSAALARFDPVKEDPVRNDVFGASQRYGFHVGGIDLLIRADTVAELVEEALIFHVPNAPLWLRGLINLRGNLVPIYDLRVLLDVADENGRPAQRIMIMDRGEHMVGVLIDGLPESIRSIGMSTSIPPLPSILKRYVSNAYAGSRTIWLEFDHRAFFLAVASGKADRDKDTS